MNHNFTGFNTNEVTLDAASAVAAGKAITLADSYTADIPSAGADFCGVCSAVRGSHASVVFSGHTTVAFSGTAPTVGYCKLVADGNGGVKLGDSGRAILVVGVDTDEAVIDIII